MADKRWSDEELFETVKAYMEMLKLEKTGRPYSKAAFRRGLMAGPLPARSTGAIEYRMQNISSFLNDLGLDWIEGYKPASHIGPGVRVQLQGAFERYEVETEQLGTSEGRAGTEA